MTTFEMLKKSITNKKNRNEMDDLYIELTKSKLDVFFMNNRITEEEFSILSTMLNKEELINGN